MAIVGGIVLFCLTAFGARHGQLQPWEERLFYDVFNWSGGLRWLFLAVTQLGSAGAVAIVTLGSFLIGYRQLAWRLLLSGVSAYLLVIVAKGLINRPRPYALLSSIHERELSVHGLGFPSGHTAVATAMALTLAFHLPKQWRWIPAVWIAGVGLSRVYLGVHAPLDIIGGFAIGLVTAATLHFLVNTEGKLHRSRP